MTRFLLPPLLALALFGCGPADPDDTSTTTTEIPTDNREDCTNGIDDDGDGHDDCTDQDCPDADNDGFADSCDICPGGRDGSDTDGDGAPDACDPCPSDSPDDSDGDGVCDSDDLCEGDDTQDADGDGVPDDCDICEGFDGADSDGDTVPDDCDICPSGDDAADADSDGVPDACDACPGSDDGLDADGDTVPDACDICADADDNLDTDGDGAPDGCDLCAGFDDAADADTDGVADGCDACEGYDDTADADTDGVPDDCDICAAGDDHADGDADSVPDACDICLFGDDALDTDNDTVPNACDLCEGSLDIFDRDRDGMPDDCDVCEGDDMLQSDGDALPDECDNCPLDDNLDQSDWDLDGIGDACQPNGCNYLQFAPLRSVPGPTMTADPVYLAARFHALVDIDGILRDFQFDDPLTPVSAVFQIEYHDGALQEPLCTISWDLSGTRPSSTVPSATDQFTQSETLQISYWYDLDLDPAEAVSSCPPVPSHMLWAGETNDPVEWALGRFPVDGIGYGNHSEEWYNQLGNFIGQPLYDDEVKPYSIGMFFHRVGDPNALEFGEALIYERTCDTVDYHLPRTPAYDVPGKRIPANFNQPPLGPALAGAVFVVGL